MSLYKVGSIYYVDLTAANGKRHRTSAHTTDKAEAQAFHEQLRSQLWRQNQLGEAPPVTWESAVAKWMAVKPRGMPAQYTLNALEISFDEPLPLTSTLIASCIGKHSPGTFNRALNLINAIQRLSGVTPAKVDRRPNPQGRTRWLTAEEWARLQKALKRESPLLAQAAEFAINTGLRENNVLNLEWSQVDMKRRVAWIHGDQVKTRQPIGVPLNDGAVAVLEARRGEHKTYCFANPDTGLPYYKASNRAWYQALRRAKPVGVRWHDLRHTWASWHVMNGTRLEELMRLGGWKTTQMVMRYAHLSPEHLAGVAAQVRPVSLRHSKGSTTQLRHTGG